MVLNETGFDSLHITPEAIRELLIGLHRNEELYHHYLLDVGDYVLEVAVQAVRRCWIETAKRSGSGRHPIVTYPVMCSTPLLFNLRSASALADEGFSGQATINLALIFEPPAHMGVVPPKFVHSVRLDFTPTQEADVVLPPNVPIADRLKRAMLQFAKETFSGTYPLPEGELRDLSAQGPLEIVSVLDPQPQLVVRLLRPLRDASGRRLPTEVPKGVRLGSPGEAQWHLVVGPERVQAALRKALFQALPEGLRGHFDSREASKAIFSDGVLTSQFKKAGTDSIPISVRADTLESGSPRWTIEAPSVGLCATKALASLIPQPEKEMRLLTPDEPTILRGITFNLASHQIQRTGLHMSGYVGQAAVAAPVAEFAWFRKPSTALTVTFYAFRSWCPGSSIQEVTWDFGDGSVQTSRADNVELAVTHTFASNGPYTVRLRITDEAARQVLVEHQVTLGTLQIQAAHPIVTAQGTMRSRVHVTSGNSPLADTEVSIESVLGNVVVRTDEFGFAEIKAPFAVFPGKLTPNATGRHQIGAAASLTIVSSRKRSSFPISVMDKETHAAILDTTALCRQHGNPQQPPDNRINSFAIQQLGRRARSLEAALWRGEMPSWWRSGRELQSSHRASALEIRQMGERLKDVAARALKI